MLRWNDDYWPQSPLLSTRRGQMVPGQWPLLARISHSPTTAWLWPGLPGSDWQVMVVNTDIATRRNFPFWLFIRNNALHSKSINTKQASSRKIRVTWWEYAPYQNITSTFDILTIRTHVAVKNLPEISHKSYPWNFWNIRDLVTH